MSLQGEELGSELVEFALVLPVFVMVIFGIIAFAVVTFGFCNITFATRSAARYASVHSDTSLNPATVTSVAAVVTPYLVAVPSGGAKTSVTYSPVNSNLIGSTVTVRVDAMYIVAIPYTSLRVFNLSSSAQRTITR